jgi:hypothetical protein
MKRYQADFARAERHCPICGHPFIGWTDGTPPAQWGFAQAAEG